MVNYVGRREEGIKVSQTILCLRMTWLSSLEFSSLSIFPCSNLVLFEFLLCCYISHHQHDSGAIQSIVPISPLNFSCVYLIICWSSSLSYCTENWKGNYVLQGAPCNTYGFLLRDIYISSTELNSTIWSKQWLYLKHVSYRKYSFQGKYFSQGNNVLDCTASNSMAVFESKCFFSTLLNRPIWRKQRLSPPWKLWFAGNFPFKH
jgi:hypothetical protein